MSVARARDQFVDSFEIEVRFAEVLIADPLKLYQYAEQQVRLLRKHFPGERDMIRILDARLKAGQGRRREAPKILDMIGKDSKYYLQAVEAKSELASGTAEKLEYTLQLFKTFDGTPDDPKRLELYTNTIRRLVRLYHALGDAKNVAKYEDLLFELEGSDEKMVKRNRTFTRARGILFAAEKGRDNGRNMDTKTVQGALKNLEELIYVPDPICGYAYCEIAHAYLLLGDPETAIKKLKESYQLMLSMEQMFRTDSTLHISQSPLAGAYYYLGEAYFLQAKAVRKKDKDASKKLLIKALSRFGLVKKKYKGSSFDAQAIKRMVFIKEILITKYGVDPEKIDRIIGGGAEQGVKIKLAHEQFNDKKYKKALALYKEAVRLKGDHTLTAYKFTVYCEVLLGNFDKGMKTVDVMLKNRKWRGKDEIRDIVWFLGGKLSLEARNLKSKKKLDESETAISAADKYFGIFLKLAPNHHNSPIAASQIAENQLRKANLARAAYNALVKSGAAVTEIVEQKKKMIASYESCILKYGHLAKRYGNNDKGIRAHHKLGWVYFFIGDKEKCAQAFLDYCDRQLDSTEEKVEAKYLAGDQLMRHGDVDAAIVHLREVIKWLKVRKNGYPVTARTKLYRQKAFGLLGWCYDKQATSLLVKVVELEKELQLEKDILNPPKPPENETEPGPVTPENEDAPGDTGAGTNGAPAPGTSTPGTEGSAAVSEAAASDPEPAKDGPPADGADAAAAAPVMDPAEREARMKLIAKLEQELKVLRKQVDIWQKRAIAQLSEYNDMYPSKKESPNYLLKIAVIHISRKEFGPARAPLEELNRKYPKSKAAEMALFSQFRAYFETGQPHKAKKLGDQITAKLPVYTVNNINFILKMLFGDNPAASKEILAPELALACLEELMSRHADSENAGGKMSKPRRERIMLQMVTCNMQLEKYETAASLCERMLKENDKTPYYYDLLFFKGTSYRKVNRLTDSIDALDEILTYVNREKHPKIHSRALIESGTTMLLSADVKVVKGGINRFIDIAEFTDSKDEFDRYLLEEAYYHLALGYAYLGDRDKRQKFSTKYVRTFRRGKYRLEIRNLPPKKF